MYNSNLKNQAVIERLMGIFKAFDEQEENYQCLNLKNKKEKNIWWIPSYYFSLQEKTPGEVNNYSYGNFSVALCSKCNFAWELSLVGKKRIPVYYDNFPRYKLKKVKCPSCKEKE